MLTIGIILGIVAVMATAAWLMVRRVSKSLAEINFLDIEL